jgi:hypothetical protein
MGNKPNSSFKKNLNASTIQIISEINENYYYGNFWKESKESIIIKSIGILIKDKSSLYALTNFNAVRFANTIKIYLDNGNSKKIRFYEVRAKIICESIELGLTLLEVDYPVDWRLIDNVITISDINPEYMPDNFPVNLYYVNYGVIKNKLFIDKRVINNVITAHKYKRLFDKFSSLLPFYECQLENIVEQDFLLGSPVTDNKGSIVGLISGYYEKGKTTIYQMTSAITMLRLLNDYFVNKNDVIKLLGFPFTCDGSVVITENIDTKYMDIKNINHKFKKGDVIKKICGINLPDNCNVYSPVLKSYMPIDAYISLHIYNIESLDIQFERNGRIITWKLKNPLLVDGRPMPLSYNLDCKLEIIDFFGLMFMIPCVELVNIYKRIYNINEYQFDILKKSTLVDNNKYLILVDIKITEKTDNIIKLLSGEDKKLILLHSINNKSIGNMDDVIKIKSSVKKYKIILSVCTVVEQLNLQENITLTLNSTDSETSVWKIS